MAGQFNEAERVRGSQTGDTGNGKMYDPETHLQLLAECLKGQGVSITYVPRFDVPEEPVKLREPYPLRGTKLEPHKGPLPEIIYIPRIETPGEKISLTGPYPTRGDQLLPKLDIIDGKCEAKPQAGKSTQKADAPIKRWEHLR